MGLSWCAPPTSPSSSPPSLEDRVGELCTLCSHIYYLINEEHEYEAQDKGNLDDMRDGIVLVCLTPPPPPPPRLPRWRTGREELAHIYYLIDEEHEYEAQDEGDPDDVRDRIVLVRLTPLLLASLAVISVSAVMTLLLDNVSSHYVTCNINLYHRLF
jgi:hypothetical protein